jgi:hypothetical protein
LAAYLASSADSPLTNTIGMRKIANGRAFAQEFWVGDDKFFVRRERPQAPFDLAARTHRHRRLAGDDNTGRQMGGQLFDDRKHVTEIGIAIAAGNRRANG